MHRILFPSQTVSDSNLGTFHSLNHEGKIDFRRFFFCTHYVLRTQVAKVFPFHYKESDMKLIVFAHYSCNWIMLFIL